MYRALYAFQSNDANALSFSEGDTFTLIDRGKDVHWWLVQNGKGQVGFVPESYLQQDQATVGDVVKSIDRAMAAIHAEASRRGGYTESQRSNLQKLHKHRDNVLAEQKCDASQDSQKGSASSHLRDNVLAEQKCHSLQESQKGSTSSQNNAKSVNRRSHRQAPLPPRSGETSVNQSSTTPPSSNSTTNTPTVDKSPTELSPDPSKNNMQVQTPSKVTVPEAIGSELVDKVRGSTGLSYKASIDVVHTVVSHIKQRIPGLEVHMDSILETLCLEHSEVDLNSDDAKKLEYIFQELAKCKDDSQQRSWFLHEDEHIISKLLEDLLSILNGADSDICKVMVSQDHYAAVDNLVLYYQMETRLSLRLLLLQVFGSLCGLSPKIISEMLNSVLACELARDIMTDTQEIQKFNYSCLVLAMLFSQGESIAQHYYTQLNVSFIHYLLDTIEDPPSSDTGEQVPDLLLNVVLAFNLHFELPEENTVMKVIAEKGTAKVLSEKLLLLVNRGDDPVRMFNHEPKPPNAVLKFLSDLYSTPSTSNLLYTNDVKVLIDIVLRQLKDLPAEDDLRTEYLSIMELILKNHNYAEHFHRRSELEECFKQIYNEEEVSSDQDKRIIVQIWTQLPDIFESDCI